MIRCPLLLLALIAAPVAAKRAAPPDLGTITLDRANPAIDATIAGVAAHLAIRLDDDVDLMPAYAVRVPLQWERTDYVQVGRVRVPYKVAAAPVAIAGVTALKEIGSHDGAASCCAGYDGSIGAVELPWSVVRIGDSGGRAEQLFPASQDLKSGISVPWTVNGEIIHVVLAPDLAETTATASAAVILAKANGGHLQDDVREVPVAYGVLRPVRTMRFDRPILPLGLNLDRIAVRIGDFAGDEQLLDTRAALPPPGPGEIEVRHKPIPPQFRWAAITIGRDLLGRCPLIAVYRDTGEIGLACDPVLAEPAAPSLSGADPLHARP